MFSLPRKALLKENSEKARGKKVTVRAVGRSRKWRRTKRHDLYTVDVYRYKTIESIGNSFVTFPKGISYRFYWYYL